LASWTKKSSSNKKSRKYIKYCTYLGMIGLVLAATTRKIVSIMLLKFLRSSRRSELCRLGAQFRHQYIVLKKCPTHWTVEFEGQERMSSESDENTQPSATHETIWHTNFSQTPVIRSKRHRRFECRLPLPRSSPSPFSSLLRAKIYNNYIMH